MALAGRSPRSRAIIAPDPGTRPSRTCSTGAVGVTFISRSPLGAPVRVAVALTQRQREVLRTLAVAVEPLPFARIVVALRDPPSDRTIRNELVRLRQLGLVETHGHGRGATWRMMGNNKSTE